MLEYICNETVWLSELKILWLLKCSANSWLAELSILGTYTRADFFSSTSLYIVFDSNYLEWYLN